MKKLHALLGLGLGLYIGNSLATAANVNIVCWSGDHMIYNDIVSEWNINIARNYILINKDKTAHIIIGDCILSRKIEVLKKHKKK